MTNEDALHLLAQLLAGSPLPVDPGPVDAPPPNDRLINAVLGAPDDRMPAFKRALATLAKFQAAEICRIVFKHDIDSAPPAAADSAPDVVIPKTFAARQRHPGGRSTPGTGYHESARRSGAGRR